MSVYELGLVYYDENGNRIDNRAVEGAEQVFAYQYTPADAVVLELGARYGTVSCSINRKITNKTAQVSVEPDWRVWDALEKNRTLNGADFNIVKGFISRKPLDITGDDYATTFKDSDLSSVPSYTVEDIQQRYNLQFTALIADCEGFMETFLKENPTFLKQLTYVQYELDRPDFCNYDFVRNQLVQHGFRNIVPGFQEVWVKP